MRGYKMTWARPGPSQSFGASGAPQFNMLALLQAVFLASLLAYIVLKRSKY